jgi:ubiquinone/menaquinone biosynthesis C-methylase UbiE/protein-S-isoprenylcysteine O-methyltransferase Ste14
MNGPGPSLRIGLFAFVVFMWLWAYKLPLSPGMNFAIIVGGLLLVFPVVFLGRKMLDKQPTAERAAWTTTFVHYSLLLLFGVAIIRAIVSQADWPGPTIPIPDEIGRVLVIITSLAALLTVANLALRGIGAPFAIALSKKLAVDWLYAWTRNPMVLASLILLLAVGVWFQSALFLLWALVLVTPALLTFVKVYEERELEVRFGAPYLDYKARTPFLFPRRPGAVRSTIPRQPNFEGIDDPDAARAYDRISRWPQFRLLRRMNLRELEKYHPSGTIVDVGCGPGYLVTLIAKRFPGLQVIGVDISAEIIETAARNVSMLELNAQVSFRQGDSQRLPFDNGAVDFVISTFSLHHWSEPEQALREIQRVLQPGGQFLLFDLRRDAPRLFYRLIKFAQTIVVPAALRRVNEPVGSVLASYTPTEVEAFIRGTSFREWKITPGFSWMFIWGRV